MLLRALTIVLTLIALWRPASAACPAADPGPLPYTTARPPSDACALADISFVEAEAKNPDATFASLRAALESRSAACAACVFANESDAAWGPLVLAGDTGFVNYGACYERSPTGTFGCAQALQRFERCAESRCPISPDACPDEASAAACLTTVASDPTSCGQYTYETACPTLDLLSAACPSYIAAIKVMCASPSLTGADGGTAIVTEAPNPRDASTRRDSADAGRRPRPLVWNSPATENSGCTQGAGPGTGAIAVAVVIALLVARRTASRQRAGSA
jgi:hypothetical protein